MESKQSSSSSSPEHKQSLAESKSSPPSIVVDILSCDCQPVDDCEVTDGLDLEVDFDLSENLSEATWEMKYLVDSMRKRHVIALGETEMTNYEAGPNSFLFSVDGIDVKNIKPGALTNAGLLSCVLKDGEGEEVFCLNFVVQVRHEGDKFVRTIFSPLE